MTTRRVIVDHVQFVVSDLEASRRFYTAALAPVGLSELCVQEDGVHYGADELDDFAIYGGSPATTAAHVAFDAPNRRSVDAFFRAAIAGGGRERGRPGCGRTTPSGTMPRSSTTRTGTTSKPSSTAPSRSPTLRGDKASRERP